LCEFHNFTQSVVTSGFDQHDWELYSRSSYCEATQEEDIEIKCVKIQLAMITVHANMLMLPVTFQVLSWSYLLDMDSTMKCHWHSDLLVAWSVALKTCLMYTVCYIYRWMSWYCTLLNVSLW